MPVLSISSSGRPRLLCARRADLEPGQRCLQGGYMARMACSPRLRLTQRALQGAPLAIQVNQCLGARALCRCHFGTELLQRLTNALVALPGRTQLGRNGLPPGSARVRLGLRLDRL